MVFRREGVTKNFCLFKKEKAEQHCEPGSELLKCLERVDSPMEGSSPSSGGLAPGLGDLPSSLGGLGLSAGDIAKLMHLRQALTPKMCREDI